MKKTVILVKKKKSLASLAHSLLSNTPLASKDDSLNDESLENETEENETSGSKKEETSNNLNTKSTSPVRRCIPVLDTTGMESSPSPVSTTGDEGRMYRSSPLPRDFSYESSYREKNSRYGSSSSSGYNSRQNSYHSSGYNSSYNSYNNRKPMDNEGYTRRPYSSQPKKENENPPAPKKNPLPQKSIVTINEKTGKMEPPRKSLDDPNARVYLLTIFHMSPLKEKAKKEEKYKKILEESPELENNLFIDYSRSIGIFRDYDTTKEVIDRNKRDICNLNQYNVAVIEKVPFNMFPKMVKRWFFEMRIYLNENSKQRYSFDPIDMKLFSHYNDVKCLGLLWDREEEKNLPPPPPLEQIFTDETKLKMEKKLKRLAKKNALKEKASQENLSQEDSLQVKLSQNTPEQTPEQASEQNSIAEETALNSSPIKGEKENTLPDEKSSEQVSEQVSEQIPEQVFEQSPEENPPEETSPGETSPEASKKETPQEEIPQEDFNTVIEEKTEE